MTIGDDWFRHKGRWPLTTHWPEGVEVDGRPSVAAARVAMAEHNTSAVAHAAAAAPSSSAPSLLTTSEAAKVVRLSPRTLERLRVSGEGPRYIKAGPGKRAKVLYREADLAAWLEQFSYGSTSEYAVARGASGRNE